MGKAIERMKELFDKVEKVEPMAERDGQVFVDFEDAALLNSANAYEKDGGTGMQVRNPDGSIASTGKTVHAMNPNYFFANRYKVRGSKGREKLYVVAGHEPTGFRCIQEQERGRIHIKTIPCYVFVREAAEGEEKGKLVLDRVTTISDTEFISDFTNTLNNKSMAEILPMITSYGNDLSADEMPI